MLTICTYSVKIVYIGGKEMDASKITFKADLTGYEILLLRNLVDKRIQELKKRVKYHLVNYARNMMKKKLQSLHLYF